MGGWSVIKFQQYKSFYYFKNVDYSQCGKDAVPTYDTRIVKIGLNAPTIVTWLSTISMKPGKQKHTVGS